MADSLELIGGGQRKDCPLDEKGLTAQHPLTEMPHCTNDLDTNPKL